MKQKYNISKQIFTITKDQTENNNEDGANFEEAIEAASFGKFNIFLILSVIPAALACIQEVTTMSYVFPAAQCDLELDLEDKGLLNAITYGGTISSAFLWGYFFDMFGRKKLLVIGLLLDALFVVLSAFSQNLTSMVLIKFLGGFVISSPFGGVTAYLSELHGAKYRSQMPLLVGFSFAIGTIYLPLLAAFILPLDIKWEMFDNFYFYSWGLFLVLTAIPALLSGILFVFLPESPKYLMSKGEHDKALDVFRRIYAINTGNPPSEYPITKLNIASEKIESDQIEEETPKLSKWSAIQEGCSQIIPLIKPPHLLNFSLVCSIELFSMCSLNTLRLWLPQLFQVINDYKFLNNGTSETLCVMLDIIRPESGNSTEECFVNLDNFEVYVNSIIISVVTLGAYIVTSLLMNALGPKLLLFIVTFGGGLFATGIYFSPSGEIAVILIAGNTALCSLATMVVLHFAVELFPTTLRTMSVSLCMMFGRAASMLGNVIFPLLLEMGCGPPFAMIAFTIFICSIFTLILPKSKEDED